MGVIYKSENVSTLPPLTRSPSPNRGGFSAGSRSSWRKGRLASCSRRDSPAPAPYPVRFVAANSAFSVFRFAKRRKPLRPRSSSPKVLRLSGSPLNHWTRFASLAPKGKASGRIISAPTVWGNSTRLAPYRRGCAATRAGNTRPRFQNISIYSSRPAPTETYFIGQPTASSIYFI